MTLAAACRGLSRRIDEEISSSRGQQMNVAALEARIDFLLETLGELVDELAESAPQDQKTLIVAREALEQIYSDAQKGEVQHLGNLAAAALIKMGGA